MVKYDRIFNGLFSSNPYTNENSYIYHQYDIKPSISSKVKNNFYQDIDIHINSSKTQLIPISGSNNQGLILNDAQFNMTNIFDQPIIFYLNQYSMFLYIIFVLLLVLIFIFILSFIYHRKCKQIQTQATSSVYNKPKSIIDHWKSIIGQQKVKSKQQFQIY
jgi:hypothetical protein